MPAANRSPHTKDPRSTLIDHRLHRAATRLVAVDAGVVAVLAALVWQNSAQATNGIDRRVAGAMYAQPASAIRSLFAAITLGGKPAVVIVLALVVAALTWRRLHDRLLAAFCPVAVAASSIIEKVFKIVVGRSRPATALLAHVTGRSFPSGHASAAAALATTAALLIVAAGLHRRWQLFALLVAYSVAVSASRIVLGVHYLTDVIAGSAIGVGVPLAIGLAISRSKYDTESPSPN